MQTKYYLRADRDMPNNHAMLRTIQLTVDFDKAREYFETENPAMVEWIATAKNQWPDPLIKLEAVLAVAAFEVYAKSILFILYMEKEGIPYAEYSKNGEKQNDLIKKSIKGPPQNIRTVLSLLKKEFDVDVQIAEQDLEQLLNAMYLRHRFIHEGTYFDLIDSENYWAWVSPDEGYKEFYSKIKLGVIPQLFMQAMKKIDEAVLKKYKLPRELVVLDWGEEEYD